MIALILRDLKAVWNAITGQIHLIPAILRRYPEIIVLQSSGTGIQRFKIWIPSRLLFIGTDGRSDSIVRPYGIPLNMVED